jgi:F0F1-type ATP synthase membrane subunit c/vacuolar-type H+-ATPase subunit K
MLALSEKEAIEKGFITLKIIWMAMFGTLFIYVIICHKFGYEIRQTSNTQIPITQLKYIFLGLSIGALFLANHLRRIMLTVRSNGAGMSLLGQQSYSKQPQALGKYTIAVVVSLALSESIGMFGLVLFFLGDSFQTLYTFIIISAFAMLYYRPKQEELATLAISMKMEKEQTSQYLH